MTRFLTLLLSLDLDLSQNSEYKIRTFIFLQMYTIFCPFHLYNAPIVHEVASIHRFFHRSALTYVIRKTKRGEINKKKRRKYNNKH